MKPIVRHLGLAALTACAASQQSQQRTPAQIVGAQDRTDRDVAMDSHRKPVQMLAFFGAWKTTIWPRCGLPNL